MMILEKKFLNRLGKIFCNRAPQHLSITVITLNPKVDEVINCLPQMRIKPMNWKRAASTMSKENITQRKRVKKTVDTVNTI